jgi:hypothetical protein
VSNDGLPTRGWCLPAFESSQGTFKQRISPSQKADGGMKGQRMDDRLGTVKLKMASPYVWTRFYTKTYNEHWMKEGRPRPEEPFPDKAYIRHVFDVMDLDDVIWWEKSRDMMLSWCCVAYLTYHAMTMPYCGILFQTQKDKKVIQLVDYAKHLYRNSEADIKDAHPLAKTLERQSHHELQFANGSYIIGIPGGADQIRSYHPWGYLNDESSFQPDAGECYNEAIAAVAGKIIFNSSAGPGWYADARRDVVRNNED